MDSSKEELTRGKLPIERERLERARWFIRLRWFAALGIFVLSGTSTAIFHVQLPLLRIFSVAAVVLILNTIYFLSKDRIVNTSVFAHLQIMGDWLALAFIAHYTGGIESPVLLYFIFHIIISSILLTRVECFLHATVAFFLVGFLGLMEYGGFLSHVQIKELFPVCHFNNPWYLFSVLFFVSSTFYVAAYLATSVTQRLWKSEEELAEAYMRLEAADRTKSEFVLKVTHELRAPLSAIESLLRALEEGYAGEAAPKVLEILGRVEQRSRFLLQLVNDLLDLAVGKLERPRREEFKEVRIDEAIGNILALMRTRMETKGIKLDLYTEPVSLLAVPQEIDLILTNLIDNAIKYTPGGGSISIEGRRVNNYLNLKVSDTGIGIPAEARPRVFEEFFRADNARSMEKEGTGLGLTIVKNLVVNYNGELIMESELNKGTTFTVRLPIETKL